ncbi:unnamed protein product [Linum tenue]|uniref:Uncharacterized protein n=1 Tax=Linum tenue TaxID=586396 RepID=A0AAV0RXQ5_9ROSI|nr:unnamed protein product [Linum tenue]
MVTYCLLLFCRELDVLSRQHVQSLPRMIIKDEIGKQVKFSLEAAQLAQTNASVGLYEASAGSILEASQVIGRRCLLPPLYYVSQLLLLRALFCCLLAILPASVIACAPCGT